MLMLTYVSSVDRVRSNQATTKSDVAFDKKVVVASLICVL
jgi:hypothetical protein